tara:strand:+ start:477 stop:746 length:270 start_codon:yes stop_codon:yes gene_type:complete
MSKVVESIAGVLNEKVVQIALVSGVLFYILANTTTFDFVQGVVEKVFKTVGLTVKIEGSMQLVFHSLVFAGLLFIITKFMLAPLVKMIK